MIPVYDENQTIADDIRRKKAQKYRQEFLKQQRELCRY